MKVGEIIRMKYIIQENCYMISYRKSYIENTVYKPPRNFIQIIILKYIKFLEKIYNKRLKVVIKIT